MRLSPDDIIRLGPEVMERLRPMLPFENGACWVPSSENHDFPTLKISRRQKERAHEAFSEGMPFWDLVGSSVIIPVPCMVSGTDSVTEFDRNVNGALVLSGVSRAVVPEEPERWLPLLCSWVETAFSSCKTAMLQADSETALPPYVVRAVAASAAGLNVLHLDFSKARGTADYENLVPVIESVLGAACEKGCNLRLELSGYSPHDLWLIVYGLDEPALSSAISRFFLLPSMKRTGVRQAFIHTLQAGSLPDKGTAEEALSEQVASTEYAAMALGMPVFSEVILSDIEKRFECTGLGGVLGAASMHRGVRFAAAFASLPAAALHKLRPGQDCFDHYYTATSGSSVLFVKKVRRGEHLQFDLKEWGRKIRDALASVDEGAGTMPVGVAASWQQTLSSSTARGAAFWAYVHAFMLHTGSIIVHDAVTWQVRGDELIASGALRHACRAFRKALVLDDSRAEIWNSLGVCLARLGSRKEAEKAFFEASRRNPDDFMTFYNLCGIQHSLKDYSSAEASCRRALEIRSGDAMALTRLGQVLLDSGKISEAEECLHQAAEAETPPPAVWRLLGTALYMEGKWTGAKRALEKALRLKPDDVTVRTYLALGYAEHEKDITTARRLAQGLMHKGMPSVELRRISARLSSILAESSLDKE